MGSMGALIAAITNPGNHAPSRPKGREPSGSDRHYPSLEPRLHHHFYHESRQPCSIPSPRRREPSGGNRQPQAGTMTPRLLLSRIHATMPHPVPQGREPSGFNRHYPKPDQGSLITTITNPCDHAHLAHGMFPVATGSGGPSGLEDSPHVLARENIQRARSP